VAVNILGSRPFADFDVNGVESSGYATTVAVTWLIIFPILCFETNSAKF